MAQQLQSASTERDFFAIRDVDYLEIYTGNAKQAAYFFCLSFGFRLVAYSGLETGNRDHVSYVLEQGKIRLVVSGAYGPDHPIAEFVKQHGDGVKDIALLVDDVESAFSEAVSRGGIPVKEPHELRDEHGVIKKAVIGTYGDTVHTLIERHQYHGLCSLLVSPRLNATSPIMMPVWLRLTMWWAMWSGWRNGLPIMKT